MKTWQVIIFIINVKFENNIKLSGLQEFYLQISLIINIGLVLTLRKHKYTI